MTISELLQLLKKGPVVVLAIIILILLCGYAKAYVDNKHETAMVEIASIKESQVRVEKNVNRLVITLIGK